MAEPAFVLTADNEDAALFLAAWKQAIRVSGRPNWYGINSPQELERTDVLRLLAPRVPQIAKHILEVPHSQAAFASAMVGLFNPAEGAKLANKIQTEGLGNLLQAITPAQRDALRDLITHYKGW